MSEAKTDPETELLNREVRELSDAILCRRAGAIRLGIEAVEAVAMHTTNGGVRNRAVSVIANHALDGVGATARCAGEALARLGISTLEL